MPDAIAYVADLLYEWGVTYAEGALADTLAYVAVTTAASIPISKLENAIACNDSGSGRRQ